MVELDFASSLCRAYIYTCTCLSAQQIITCYSCSQICIVTRCDVSLPTPRHFGEKFETRYKLPFSVIGAGLHTFCCNWAQPEVLWLWGELKAFIRSIAVLSPRFSWPVICYDYDCVIGWLDFRISGQTQMEWCLTHNHWKKYLIFYRDPLRLCT